jgi:hypothetical protein
VKYNTEMDTYLGCIKGEYDTKVAGLTSPTKEDLAKLEKAQSQKQDAAIKEVTDVTDRFNEQLRGRKAKNTPEKKPSSRRPRSVAGSKDMPMLTPAQANTHEQHLTCLPIESLPLTQIAGAVLREHLCGRITRRSTASPWTASRCPHRRGDHSGPCASAARSRRRSTADTRRCGRASRP